MSTAHILPRCRRLLLVAALGLTPLAAASDLVLDGDNAWRLHTPDDGRQALFFGHREADTGPWRWPFTIFPQGGVRMDGDLIVSGGRLDLGDGAVISQPKDPEANKNIDIRGQGLLWVGTKDGLHIRKDEERSGKLFVGGTVSVEGGCIDLGDGAVISQPKGLETNKNIDIRGQGLLWVGTANGVHISRGSGRSGKLYVGGNVMIDGGRIDLHGGGMIGMSKDLQGRMVLGGTQAWVGMSQGMVLHHDPSRNIDGRLVVGGTMQVNKLARIEAIVTGNLLVKANWWADHVFDEGYELMPLAEVKAFIAEHKHLPDMPSEREIVDGEGLEVDDMLARQQQKIEELTLHAITQQELIERLEARLVALERR